MINYYFRQDYAIGKSLKIYISRNKSGKRLVLNEEAILPILKDSGYMILYLEEMSIADQVNIFTRTQSMVSIHGAGLSNMAFMPQGGSIMEIRHKENNHMLNFFISLAATFQHKYYYCYGYRRDGHVSPVENRPEDISIDVDARMFAEILENMD